MHLSVSFFFVCVENMLKPLAEKISLTNVPGVRAQDNIARLAVLLGGVDLADRVA